MNAKNLLPITRFGIGLLILLSIINSSVSTFAQGTAFTYQGRLADTVNPVNGFYDLRFFLYDSGTGGTLVAGPVTNSPVVISNGLFTVTLDFGANVFTGANRWLEIGVRTNGGNAFTPLSPRQQLTPAPYAITAENLVSGGLAAGIYGNPVTFNNPGNSFCGDGGCLSNVNASSLGGLTSADFWRLNGNTVSPANFLGTLNNLPLEIKVNNNHALRIVPASVPSLEGGYFQNSTHGFSSAAIVGGGTSGSINEVFGNYGFIGAGHGAKAGGFSAVVDGGYNVAPGQFSFVGCGLRNSNLADYSFIGSGGTNYIAPDAVNSFIGGGTLNSNVASWSVIGGGSRNSTPGPGAFVGGGGNNTAADFNTVIAGGANNRADANASAIAGGSENHASGDHNSIGGGQGNFTSGNDSTIAGGVLNQVTGDNSTIGGGAGNAIYTNFFDYLNTNNTICGGGFNNMYAGVASVIAGGWSNSMYGDYPGYFVLGSAIGGGRNNTIGVQTENMEYGTIAGGANNFISYGSGVTIGGGTNNSIIHRSNGATIAGGTRNTIDAAVSATIGGGTNNTVNSPHAVVGGGDSNASTGDYATVSGGGFNQATGRSSFVGGGGGRDSSGGGPYGNTASGDWGTVGGGWFDLASGYSSTVGGGAINHATNAFATVPGGAFNVAGGTYSFAAGQQAYAVHQGSFVWADSQGTAFASTTNDQFSIRAQGGVRLNNDTSMFCGSQTRQMLNLWSTQYGIGVQAATEYFRSGSDFSWFKGGVHSDSQNNPGGGVEMMRLTSSGLTVNGVFVSASDRNLKENFQPVNGRDVLEKVAALPVSKWNFKADPESRHVGPMAQDFYAAFGVGPDDKHITTVDEGGVALAAIQGLNQKLEEKEARIHELEERLSALEQLVRREH